MSILKDNYNRIMSEVEERIKNPEELEFVKKKISELSSMFIDVLDEYTNTTEARIKKIEDKQNQIEVKIDEVENFFDEMEAEIFEENEENTVDSDGYDFEIVCPYCDSEFVADISGKNEITCPKCNNEIELDWNDEEEKSGCCQSGGCTKCPGCSIDNKNNQDNIENDNEDDM